MSGPSRWFTGERTARSFFAASAVVIGVGLVLQLVLAVQNDDARFATAAGRAFNFFCYFTVLSNITVAVTTGLLAYRLERRSITFRVFRVVGVIALTVTGIVYYIALKQLHELTGWDALADLLLHTAGPILAPLGWLVFGPRRGIDARIVGQAVLPPLGWLAFTLVRGALVEDRYGNAYYPYPFLNVDDHGYPIVLTNAATVAVLFLALAAAMLWLDRRLVAHGIGIATGD